ncbi:MULTISPECIES: FUSC family protein [Actinomycetes]|uniref:FUSC family protein n=1 Tax=Actinomycetes TaxID=1760 RepID=UPI000AD16A7C|nr:MULTISPECIES: FUSC family protein [Actinomycetes]
MPLAVPLINRVHRSRSALLHSLDPQTWRSAVITVETGNTAVASAVRVGLAVALVLVVGGLTGHRDVAGFAALGALTSAFCRPDPFRVRLPRLVVTGVMVTGYVAFGAVLGAARVSLATEVVAIALAAGFAALILGALRVVGPGPVVMVFAAAGAADFADSADDVWKASTAAVIGAVVGVVASLAPWFATWVQREHPHPSPARSSLVQELKRIGDAELLSRSIRIVVAGGVAAGIVAAVGLQHPMWAAMGAVATLQGVNYHLTVTRGVQRLLGNVGGAAIAAGLLALPIGYWGAVVLIAVLQVLAETLVTVNYALCSLLVTPMALMLTALGAGLAPEVAVDRVVDTAVGVVIAVVLAAFTIAHHDATV